MNDSDVLCVGLVTVSTDRSLESDAAGTAIMDAMDGPGYEIVTREHVVTDHDQVQSIVLRMIDRNDVDLVLTAGGTSIEPDDITIEAVEPLLDKELTSFREMFTAIACREIGTRIVAVRTLAGVAEGTLVICLPGNAESARLATEEIILPEARHLVDLAELEEPDDEPAEVE